MKKILLWFVSMETIFLKTVLDILERQQNGIELVGSGTGSEITKFGSERDYDILLVVGASKIGIGKVVKVARQFNLPEEKLLGDWIVCIPGFTLEKYRQLQRSRLSVFSVNCFGAMLSHSLGLPFLTPTVNMFFNEDDFIRFLGAPKVYLETEPKFEKWSDNTVDAYPILSLGNVSLNMMHYKKIDDAIAKWNERKSRINRYNLFVTMHTEREEIAQKFDALPYGKKVCFVPFKSDLDSAWYINPDYDKSVDLFVRKLFNFGHVIPTYYDPFDMLLYGKKTPLIEM